MVENKLISYLRKAETNRGLMVFDDQNPASDLLIIFQFKYDCKLSDLQSLLTDGYLKISLTFHVNQPELKGSNYAIVHLVEITSKGESHLYEYLKTDESKDKDRDIQISANYLQKQMIKATLYGSLGGGLAGAIAAFILSRLF